MGDTNTSGASDSPFPDKSLPLHPPSYTALSAFPAASASPDSAPLPLAGDPSNWKQVAFAKSILHNSLAEPSDPELVLSIYATTSKRDGMEINMMGSTLALETKRLVVDCRLKQIDIQPNAQPSKSREEVQRGRIKLAHELLEDWATYGPSTFGGVVLLAEDGEVRCFLQK